MESMLSRFLRNNHISPRAEFILTRDNKIDLSRHFVSCIDNNIKLKIIGIKNFSPKLNNIVLLFQTDSSTVERMEIMDVPMNRWFNLILVVENKSASVYVNCKMENNFSLVSSSPNTSDYNLYIAKDGSTNSDNKNGFPGFMANLSYYNYPLNQSQINDICNEYGSKFKKYQDSENSKINYTTSCLVTDSDTNNI